MEIQSFSTFDCGFLYFMCCCCFSFFTLFIHFIFRSRYCILCVIWTNVAIVKVQAVNSEHHSNEIKHGISFSFCLFVSHFFLCYSFSLMNERPDVASHIRNFSRKRIYNRKTGCEEVIIQLKIKERVKWSTQHRARLLMIQIIIQCVGFLCSVSRIIYVCIVIV